MLPEYPKFKGLEHNDIDLVHDHLKTETRAICELALANIFIWKDFDNPQITMINGNPCLYLRNPIEPPYFLEPLGRNRLKETIEVCMNHAGRISRAGEGFISLLQKGSYKIEPERSQFDYIYLTKDLAELKGKKFDGKRNHIKRFKHRFPNHEFISLGSDHKTAALGLFEKWFDIRKESRFFPKLAYTSQKNALVSAFSNFEKLKLFGGAILIEKKLKGFTLGSFLNHETACVHFMFGDPDLPGISQALLFEACNKTFSSFRYLNLEQDLGIPGLRTSKLSYHPFKLEKKFEIALRGIEPRFVP